MGLLACLATSPCLAGEPLTAANVLAASTTNDWRTPDPENTLYLTLDTGTVVIELAPRFAPEHIRNVRQLVRSEYFNGLAVFRSEENHVARWGDPQRNSVYRRSLGAAKTNLKGEFFISAKGVEFTRLKNKDAYANEIGFVDGFPAGRNHKNGKVWLAHCNGMVGAGRGAAPDSGNGADPYVINGHAERHLDRNVSLFGRVIYGMELLSTLPRGTGPIGRYETDEELVPVRSMSVASDLPEKDRIKLEILRTDTKTFDRLMKARRYRREAWFVHPVGNVSLCRMLLPVRRVR